MPIPYYQTTSEKYQAVKAPCFYCLQGRCAERKAAGLCHCGDHSETPKEANDTSVRKSQESELATN